MNWIHLVSYFFGGGFHRQRHSTLCGGHHGSLVQSPFASPPGKGLSSSKVNVLWGALNVIVAYLLVVRVGDFHLWTTIHVLVFGMGALLISLQLAHHFGQFHGGNKPSLK